MTLCPCGLRPARYPLDAPALCVRCFIADGPPAVLDAAFRERMAEQERAGMEMRTRPLAAWAKGLKLRDKEKDDLPIKQAPPVEADYQGTLFEQTP